jgi:hypothetical protein
LRLRRNLDVPTVVLVAIGIFLGLSVRPQLRLRTDMPPEFQPASGPTLPDRQAGEHKIAQAYWDCAQSVIQKEYGFSNRVPLPVEPPAEFTVQSPELDARANDIQTRKDYWERLRKIWYLDSSWKSGYKLDITWLSDTLHAVTGWLQDFANHAAKYRN